MATFSATIKDELTGITLLEDFEVEIVGYADGYDLVIDDVRTEGQSMFKGDNVTQSLACRIASQAEVDDELREEFGVKRWDVAAQRAELGTW